MAACASSEKTECGTDEAGDTDGDGGAAETGELAYNQHGLVVERWRGESQGSLLLFSRVC